MRVISIAVLAVTLAGCQSGPNLQHLQNTVGNASNYQLCRAIFMASQDVAQIAKQEAARRSLDCAPYASAVFQNEAQADAARKAAALQLLTRPAPAPVMVQPQQIPDPVNCQTYRVGNTLNTRCQ